MIIETVLSMLTLGIHFKQVMHCTWACVKGSLAYTLAMFNIAVQWNGIEVDEFCCNNFSLAPFSL